MEFLPQMRINEFKDKYGRSKHIQRTIAYSLGHGAGSVYRITSQFTRQPSDGNVLIDWAGDLVETKFIDVDHFGIAESLDAVADAFLSDAPSINRTECQEYCDDFFRGLDAGLAEQPLAPLRS
jgi:hypothetical protein